MKINGKHLEVNQERLETTSDSIASGVIAPISKMLNTLSILEITLLLESAPPTERLAIWKLIPSKHEAEILQELNPNVRAEIIKIMDAQEIQQAARSAAKNLETDDLVDLLQDLTEEKIKKLILDSLDTNNRAQVETILKFPENSAGGIMNTDAILIPNDTSVSLVVEYLQRLGELPEQTNNLFVVDKNQKFLGDLSLTNILTKPPSTIVKDIIQPDSNNNYLLANASGDEVAVFFERSDLLSVAILNENKQVIGRITADDVVNLVREQGEHTYLAIAGIDEETDTFAPVINSIQTRISWLFVTLAAAYISTIVIGVFETTIERVIALAILMPISAAIGGAAGNQTLALVLRGMLLQQIGHSNFKWLLAREMIVSLVNGILLASLIGIIVLWRFNDYYLSMIIMAAIISNLLISSILGCSLPILLKKINIDPAVSANIVLTTVTDIMGYLIFLGLATLIF